MIWQAHCYGHYSRHHVSSLLQLRAGLQKDLYQELMLQVMAGATCSMLRQVRGAGGQGQPVMRGAGR